MASCCLAHARNLTSNKSNYPLFNGWIRVGWFQTFTNGKWLEITKHPFKSGCLGTRFFLGQLGSWAWSYLQVWHPMCVFLISATSILIIPREPPTNMTPAKRFAAHFTHQNLNTLQQILPSKNKQHIINLVTGSLEVLNYLYSYM